MKSRYFTAAGLLLAGLLVTASPAAMARFDVSVVVVGEGPAYYIPRPCGPRCFVPPPRYYYRPCPPRYGPPVFPPPWRRDWYDHDHDGWRDGDDRPDWRH